MLPLSSPTLPASSEALCESLREGFMRYRVKARKITAEGAKFPKLQTLKIDLTGARANRDLPKPGKVAVGAEKIQAESFHLVASPFHFETTPIELDLRAEEAVFALAAEKDASFLVPQSLGRGEITISVARKALEVALQEIGSTAASKQGAEIKEVHLQLDSRGPQSLAFRAEVRAKMFVMSATATISGEVNIDDQLNARFSQLNFRGSGMAASAAGAFIQPYLKKYEGYTVPLMAFSLGKVKLRDLQVTGGEALRIHATFS